MATKSHFRIINESLPSPESTLVLIGTALDGPSSVPFLLNDLFSVEDILGRSPLSKAFTMASKAGSRKIILYRINGAHSIGTLSFHSEESETIDVISFRSVAASDKYNEIEIVCGPDKLSVKGTDETVRNYFFTAYPTSNAMVDAINLDAEFGLIELTASVLENGFAMAQFNSSHFQAIYLENGSSESELIPDRGSSDDISTTIASLKQRLKEALFGPDIEDQDNCVANSALGLLDFGVVSLVDMFHDDVHHDDRGDERKGEFTNILARFCFNKSTELNSGCIGVIGVKPIFSPTDQAISDKYVSLIESAPTIRPAGAAEVGTEDVTASADPYSYVQIVIGDTFTSNIFSETPEPRSLSHSYAAVQASSAVATSTSNKRLAGITKVNYEFSKEDIDSLLANGYISIVASIRKGVVPYQAITGIGEKANSLLRNPSIVRMSHVITRRISDYLDSFVGESATPVSRKNIELGLYNVMKSLVEEDKIIRTFEIQFEYLKFNSEVSVKISYVPLSYIGSVMTVVDMPFNRGVIV